MRKNEEILAAKKGATHKEMIDATYPKVGETKEKEEAENMSTLKLNTFADLLRSGASKIKKKALMESLLHVNTFF